MEARRHLVFLGLMDCRKGTQIYLWCQAGECGKEWAEVDLLPATQDHRNIWVWAAAKKYGLALGPNAAVVVCVDDCDFCYH